MARKPRIHYPGAYYHVILRGNAGDPISSAREPLALSQLTVLAPTAVIARYRQLLLLQLGLAFDAQADTREGFAPCLKDLLFALCTLSLALALRNAVPRSIDGIRHTGVYLFLHCTLRCPANCHNILFPTLYVLSLIPLDDRTIFE